MSKKQILFSVFLLLGAAAAVVVYSAAAAPEQAAGAMEGHNHAAMGAAADEATPVQVNAETARRIGITYAAAEHRPFERVVRTVGNVTYDETRLATVNPKIEGWVERLHVDFTGAPVQQGAPLLDVYSPKLVTAQEELILARRLVDEAAAAGGERAAENARTLLESARRRLRYWDIPDAEIERIEETGEPTKTLTLRAPASGIVVQKNVVEGGRIMPGMNVYEIADLSIVWVEGEVFEKDLSLVQLGQEARVTLDAYPGEVFEGTVTYVYPTVSVNSRTGRIRIELYNPGLRLKPGMYARILLRSQSGEALMVPRASVLFTGERAMVFVRQANGRTLEPREVTTGRRTDSHIEILAGLARGQVVVSSASFLIDAESNLGASMGDMEGMQTEDTGEDHSGHDMSTMAPAEEDHSGHDMESTSAPMDSTMEPSMRPDTTPTAGHGAK